MHADMHLLRRQLGQVLSPSKFNVIDETRDHICEAIVTRIEEFITNGLGLSVTQLIELSQDHVQAELKARGVVE